MFPRTFLFMLACGAVGYFLGRTRGMGLQGFFLGLAFGPLGWGLTMLWPTSWIQGPVPRDAARRGPGPRAGRPADEGPENGSTRQAEGAARGEEGPRGGCPRCRRPVPKEAGACPHCGNVLVPVHYRVG